MRSIIAASCACAAAIVAGCGGDPLDGADDVKTWVNTGSALAVYSRAHDAISFTEGHGAFADAKCPTTADDGTTVTIRGGCTDDKSAEWVGLVTVTRASDGSRSLQFDHYGHSADPNMLARVTGDFSFRPTSAATHAFDASFVEEGGVDTSIHYAGTVRGDFDTATIWNGSGTVERSGVVAPTGTVHASTTDELVDDSVCSGQPAAGQTRIESDEHVAVVTYDGKTDCDTDKAASWSLDGEDQGRISGISCALTSRRGAGADACLLLLALLAFGRRRARVR